MEKENRDKSKDMKKFKDPLYVLAIRAAKASKNIRRNSPIRRPSR
tara:strand:+ start:438 stop:572 length:135 start_codon:yes stop_codon:yes gene_type:complete